MLLASIWQTLGELGTFMPELCDGALLKGSLEAVVCEGMKPCQRFVEI